MTVYVLLRGSAAGEVEAGGLRLDLLDARSLSFLPGQINALLPRLFNATGDLVCVRVNFVVDFVEEVGFRDEFDDCVEADGNVGDLLLVALEEVRIDAPQHGLMRNHDDGMLVAFNPVNHRLQPTDEVEVGFSRRIPVLKLVFETAEVGLRILLFNLFVGECLADSGVDFVKHLEANRLDIGQSDATRSLYRPLECRSQDLYGAAALLKLLLEKSMKGLCEPESSFGEF